MAIASLVGCRVKTERAKQHLRDLHSAYERFIEMDPYGVVANRDPDSGEDVLLARVSHEPPIAWAPVIGDIVHNLRAALDYLAWELVLVGGGNPGTGTQFPVRHRPERDPGEHLAAISAQVQGAPPEAIALIDGIQPYRSSQPDLHALYVLHALDIRDKHQLLLAVVAALQHGAVSIGEGYAEHLSIGGLGAGDSLKDGAELMRVLGVNVNAQYTFDVAFEKSGPGRGEPVIPALDKLVNFVDGTLTLFGRFFP